MNWKEVSVITVLVLLACAALFALAAGAAYIERLKHTPLSQDCTREEEEASCVSGSL